MKKTMVIYDPERMYAERLAEILGEKQRELFTTIPWSSYERLREYCRSNQVDAALVHESLTREEVERLDVERVMILHDSMNSEGIYKYQSGENIVREIMTEYGDTKDEEIKGWSKHGKTRITAVFSPGGGSVKDIFAYAYSRAAAEKRKILYINLEEFSGCGAFFRESFNRDLSDLLYYWQIGSLNALKLAGIVHSCQGMDYVPPVRNCEDLNEASDEDMIGLIGYLAQSGSYEEIVLDMGTGRRFLMPLLSMAENIFVPLGLDRCAEERCRDFESYLDKAGKKNYLAKMKKMKFSVPDEDIGKGSPDEYMWGEYGEYVRRLV